MPSLPRPMLQQWLTNVDPARGNQRMPLELLALPEFHSRPRDQISLGGIQDHGQRVGHQVFSRYPNRRIYLRVHGGGHDRRRSCNLFPSPSSCKLHSQESQVKQQDSEYLFSLDHFFEMRKRVMNGVEKDIDLDKLPKLPVSDEDVKNDKYHGSFLVVDAKNKGARL